MTNEQICGKCKYHQRRDWVEMYCACAESKFHGKDTEYNETCECYEEREISGVRRGHDGSSTPTA